MVKSAGKSGRTRRSGTKSRAGRAVAAEEPVLEIEGHLRHHGTSVTHGTGDFERRNQILAPVRTQYAHRYLAAGEDHRLRKVFEHETQRRSRI